VQRRRREMPSPQRRLQARFTWSKDEKTLPRLGAEEESIKRRTKMAFSRISQKTE